LSMVSSKNLRMSYRISQNSEQAGPLRQLRNKG